MTEQAIHTNAMATIMVTPHISVQGKFVERRVDGRIVIELDGKKHVGFPVPFVTETDGA